MFFFLLRNIAEEKPDLEFCHISTLDECFIYAEKKPYKWKRINSVIYSDVCIAVFSIKKRFSSYLFSVLQYKYFFF